MFSGLSQYVPVSNFGETSLVRSKRLPLPSFLTSTDGGIETDDARLQPGQLEVP